MAGGGVQEDSDEIWGETGMTSDLAIMRNSFYAQI